MARDPLRVAVFRLEQISPLLETRLSPGERRRLVLAAARTPVTWPSGRLAPVPASTLYRWLALYRLRPELESLFPKGRPAPKRAPAIAAEWIAHALALLEQEPRRSLYILGCRLRDRFGLAQAPARASLYRALVREPRYRELRRRARGERRVRNRFQATEPHAIWQGDAKAKFRVRFADGSQREMRVLSMLDDATRFVLRALVVLEETIAAAVAVFRQAAARFGLPDAFYADRGSAYDSWVFRKGLAVLGVRRIPTKSRNPSAHGKIEAYHRSLQRWFVQELRHEVVRDTAHLQELLDVCLDRIYHEHRHRELRQKPREALAGRCSARAASLERLRQAFLDERTLAVHPKDATVRIGGTLFRVPSRHIRASRRIRVAFDPEEPGIAFLVAGPGAFEPLQPAVRPASAASTASKPAGALAPLVENLRGRTLPLASAAFGLPEIYEAFARLLGRDVPATEREAATVADWLARNGPFDPAAFHAALERVRARLGDGRPLSQILSALTRAIRPAPRKESP